MVLGAAEFCSLASRPGVCLLMAKITMGPKLCSYSWTPLSSFISLVNFCEHLLQSVSSVSCLLFSFFLHTTAI